MIARINAVTCFAAMIATLWMYWLVASNFSDRVRWGGFLIFGGWNIVVYAANALLAVVVRRSRSQSIVALISTMVVAGPSLFMIYKTQRTRFSPQRLPEGTEVMNCVGPIFELGLPVVQLTIFGLLAGVCGLMALRSNSRKPTAG